MRDFNLDRKTERLRGVFLKSSGKKEEEEEDFAQTTKDRCVEAHPPFDALRSARVKPN